MDAIEVFENGEAAFGVSRQSAWHQKGYVATDELVLDEMMALSHCDATYEKRPALWEPTGEAGTIKCPQRIPGRFAVIRRHPIAGETAVGDVGSRYELIQIRDLFAWGDDVVADSGANWESMGSLFDGKIVFGSILLPDHLGTPYGDKIKVRMTMKNVFDGSGVAVAGIHLERTVCWNTMTWNLAQAKRTWKIRHTKNALDRIEEARRALGLTFRYVEGFEQEMGKLIDQAFTDAEFERLVKQLIPDPEKVDNKETLGHLRLQRDEIMNLYSPARKEVGKFHGTAWGAYNAVAEWADWFSPIRAKDHAEARAARVIQGDKDAFKVRAQKLIAPANN
jgi:phage/plasmid-like protein (TIGR03299 family)